MADVDPELLRRLDDFEARVTALERTAASALAAHVVDAAPDGEDTAAVRRVAEAAVCMGLRTTVFSAWMPKDYYEQTLAQRMALLSAPSIDHLCKSIMLEVAPCYICVAIAVVTATDLERQNMAWTSADDGPLYPRYVIAVIQYTKRMSALKLNAAVRELKQLSRKKYDFRVADEEFSNKLTGFVHNSMAPIGLATPLPLVVDQAIADLRPAFLWLGGGNVRIKLGCSVPEFVAKVPCCRVAEISS